MTAFKPLFVQNQVKCLKFKDLNFFECNFVFFCISLEICKSSCIIHAEMPQEDKIKDQVKSFVIRCKENNNGEQKSLMPFERITTADKKFNYCEIKSIRDNC